MAEETGKVKKMWIRSFSSAEMAEKDFIGEFYALVNPETYAIDYKMEVKEGQGQGTSSKQQKFTFKKPEEFTFELLFDNTGIIDGKPNSEGVFDDITKLKDLVFKLDGTVHEPAHVHVIWGTFDLTGRVTGMNITYKLFNADGSPIRANVKLTIKGSVEEKKRIAEERLESPDLTHKRILKKGETLPWLSYVIYGDPKYYIQLAKVNNISDFRNVKPGTEIYFPPFNKKE